MFIYILSCDDVIDYIHQEGSMDRAPVQATVGLEQKTGEGTGLNDGGVHTWLDVVKAIRQVRRDSSARTIG